MFLRLEPATCFPALGAVTDFPALGTRCMFFRAWHRLRIFPRLAPAACFPALGTSLAFLRLSRFVCFPALGFLCCALMVSLRQSFAIEKSFSYELILRKHNKLYFQAFLSIFFRYTAMYNRVRRNHKEEVTTKVFCFVMCIALKTE